MPCNCSKRVMTGSYEYVNAQGVATTYASEIEAKAAKIRAGGTGEVRPKP